MKNEVDEITRRTKIRLRDSARKYVATKSLMDSLGVDIMHLFRSFIRISGSGSQTACAEELGISKAMLSEMVNGRRGIGIATVRKIAGIK